MAAQRTLYLRIGALVLAAAALAIGFTLFFTANRLGSRSDVYETYLRESVQGLDVGAPVRYRGVALGRVTEIGLVSAAYQRPEMTAISAPFQLVLVRFAVDPTRLGEVPPVDEAVRLGLRVRLVAQGITGVSNLELDFVDPTRFRVPPLPWEPRYPYVPSIPSTVAQVTSAAELLAQRLTELDIAKIVADVAGLIEALRIEFGPGGDVALTLQEATRLLATLRTQTEQADLPGVVAELRGAASEVRTLLGSREIRRTLTATADAAVELRGAVASLTGSVDRTLRTARNTTGDLQAEVAPVLRDLRQVAANLRATSEALRRSPSQTLLGGPPPLLEDRRW